MITMGELTDMSDIKKQTKNKKSNRKARLPRNRTWHCEDCDFVLGYTNRDKTELRIKFKDEYIVIHRPEAVEKTCRGCGKINKVSALPAT